MLAAAHDGFFTISHFDGYAAVLIEARRGPHADAAGGDRRRLGGVCAALTGDRTPHALASRRALKSLARRTAGAQVVRSTTQFIPPNSLGS